MTMTALQKACDILGGVQAVSDLLTETLCDPSKGEFIRKQTVYKYLRKNYAPSDWAIVLSRATKHQVTREAFDRDLLTHKRHCNPEGVFEQVDNFLQPCSKTSEPVGKHRQGPS